MSRRAHAASFAFALTLAGCTTLHSVDPHDLPTLARGETIETLDGEHVELEGADALFLEPNARRKFANLDGTQKVESIHKEEPLTTEQRVPTRYYDPVRMRSAGNSIIVDGYAFNVFDIGQAELRTSRQAPQSGAPKKDRTAVIVAATIGGLAGAALLAGAIYGLTQVDLDLGMSGMAY